MDKRPPQLLAGLAVAIHHTHILALHNLEASSNSKACKLISGVEVCEGAITPPIKVPPYALLCWDAQLHLRDTATQWQQKQQQQHQQQDL